MGDDGAAGPSGFRKSVIALRNLFSNRMRRKCVGFEAKGRPVTIGHGEALAYAAACNDANPALFEKGGGLVMPLYASRLVKEVLEDVILHPRLGMNVIRMVHAEQEMRFNRALRVGMTLTPQARIDKIREVSTGEILDVEIVLSDEEGPVVEGLSSMFVRGRGAKKKKKSDAPKGSGAEPPEFKEIGRFSISLDQPARYAAASGDYNPIHTSPFVAKLAGFGRPIAHGLCVLAVTTGKLTANYVQGDYSRLSLVAVRFAHPVYPGQELVLKVREDSLLNHFRLENDRGRPVLTEGRIAFR